MDALNNEAMNDAALRKVEAKSQWLEHGIGLVEELRFGLCKR
jgi:hypothetical protein